MKKVVIVLFVAVLSLFVIQCKGKVPVDREIMDAIKAAASKCSVDMRYAFVRNCQSSEDVKLSDIISTKAVPVSLATISVALNDPDEKIRVVACKLLYREIRDNISSIENNIEKISPATVENLIKGTANIKGYVAMYAAEAVTHIAILKGHDIALYKMLKEHPQEVVRVHGYSHLMRFGRLKVFGIVKELAKSTEPRMVIAALDAPRNMYNYTDEEKNAICPWALSYLNNDDPQVAFRAGATLNLCAGKFIDAVLDECEKKAVRGGLKAPFSFLLTNFTFSCKEMYGSPPTGTKEQCARREVLKKKIIR